MTVLKYSCWKIQSLLSSTDVSLHNCGRQGAGTDVTRAKNYISGTFVVTAAVVL